MKGVDGMASNKKPKTELSYLNETKNAMKTFGFYRAEYDPLIKIYAGLLYQYDHHYSQLVNEGYTPSETVISNKGVVSEKKSPIVATLENLRKDILSYSDRLCLNPKALNDEKYRRDKTEPQGIEAKLGEVLGSFNET